MLRGGRGRRPVGTSLAGRLAAMRSQALVRADASCAGVTEFGESQSKDVGRGGGDLAAGSYIPYNRYIPYTTLFP